MEQASQDSYTPNEGLTDAEKYLQRICKKTFLSLWSYPGLYKSSGKELCDLLVVFDNDIIIFSDKHCAFPNNGDLQKDWSRWFKKAIHRSARQAWGAERWLKTNPDKIFSDSTASTIFPFSLPDPKSARFHLIVVAHDGSKRCTQELGGSGSFMLRSDIVGLDNHTVPFTIGELDANRTYVHVLDDTSLNILLKRLDTISDFVAYLSRKERLFRSELIVFAAGEEELLAHYLKNLNNEGVHDFIFSKDLTVVALVEGIWQEFNDSAQVKRQQEADRISYVWDKLIEQFNYHALTGTQYRATSPRLQSSEKILRLLAKESRTKRRMLAKILIDLLKKTPSEEQSIRYLGSKDSGIVETTYVFLLFPRKKDITDAKYREQRGRLLQAFCSIAKLRFPNAKDIVGIATEPNIQSSLRSEDAIYLDASVWTEDLQKNAEELFNDMHLKKDVELNYYREKEYPDIVNSDPKMLVENLPHNPRNKPCPCSSGKKYKKCHGK